METQSYIRLTCSNCSRDDRLHPEQLKRLKKKYSPQPYPCPYCKAETLNGLDQVT